MGRCTWDPEDPVFEVYHVRLTDVIGKGADGAVVRGRPLKGDGMHALKVVSRHAYGLEVELESLRLLQERPHENVVRMLCEFPPHGSRPQHVLAFDEADMDLRRFLARPVGAQSCRPLADALGRQLLEGIKHLHLMPLVHRDLKPSNVLVFLQPPDPSDTAGSVRICLKIADFSRSLNVAGKVKRLRVKAPYPKVAGPLTSGVATWGYAAPEMLIEGELWAKTAEYGFGVDLWAFGCIYFEVVERQRFVPEDSVSGCRRCLEQRLGPPPPGPGFWPPIGSQARSVAELESHNAVASHPWVVGTLRWEEESRRNAQNLLVELAAASSVRPGLPEEGTACGVAAATPRASAGEELELSGDSPDVFRSLELLRCRRAGKCACAGHCYQPGHRTRPGCTAEFVVVGAKYCMLCVCCVPDCNCPRLRGPYCSAHGKQVAALPPELLLIRQVATSLPAMMPTLTSLPHFVARSRRDPDLAGLVFLGLVNAPAVMDKFHLKFADESLTDEQLAADLRRQYADAAEVLQTSPGRSGTVQGGIAESLAVSRSRRYRGRLEASAEHRPRSIKVTRAAARWGRRP